MALPKLAGLVLLLSVASSAYGACEYPQDVAIPDGGSATAEEIAAASKAVTAYIAQLNAYQACLDSEEAALTNDQRTEDTKALHVKRHNAAVDAMETAATRFNEQLRAYKARKK